MLRLLLIAPLLLPLAANAQKDTVFFNEKWEMIPTKENAAFFRPPPVKEGKRYKVTDYYINGHLQMAASYKVPDIKLLYNIDSNDLYLDGSYAIYDSTGWKENSGRYVKGHKKGRWEYYYPGSQQAWQAYTYEADRLHGKYYSYYPDGKVKREVIYKNDEMTRSKMYDPHGKVIPFTEFRRLPQPAYDVNTYLGNNITYPNDARQANIEGRVRVKFVVAESGEITGAKIECSVHPILDGEALRVVNTMPKWKPGYIDDKPVKVWYILPVTFRLED